MLRLEYLFARFNHFLRSDDPELHHNAITMLFDLGDIGARGDIKSLLLKEFERQKYALNGLKSSQKVDQEALSQILIEIDSVAKNINHSAGRPNSVITESEWLNAIRTRLNIPGGTSPIDLPSYHAWKNSPSSERRKLLENYVRPLLPWQEACQLFLRLLRQSGEAKDVLAHNGSFQQAPSGKVYQLMRIAVEDDTVRFLKADRDKKAQPINTDVSFKLTLCQF
jgi:cell division protein ZapD